MPRNEPCGGCAQKHDCKSIYRTLGNTKEPSVVLKVVFVFLVPTAVFAVSTAVFGHFLKEWIASEPARTAVTFGLAVLASLATAGVVRLLVPAWGQPRNSNPNRTTENGYTREKNI